MPVKQNRGTFAYELYHLGNDPKETNNLISGDAKLTKRLARMKADLATWQQSVIKSLNGKDYR